MPGSVCSTAPSWMLLSAPIVIGSLSPRATAPNQTLARSQVTLPISDARPRRQADDGTSRPRRRYSAMGFLEFSRGRCSPCSLACHARRPLAGIRAARRARRMMLFCFAIAACTSASRTRRRPHRAGASPRAAGSFAGPTTANQPAMSTSGKPCSANVGTSGSDGDALPAHHADRAQRAALQLALHGRHRDDAELDLAADRCRSTIGPTPLYGTCLTSTLGGIEEHLAGQVDDRAVARRRVVVRAGLGLRAAPAVPSRSSPAPCRVHDQDERRRADHRDRRDVVEGVERHLLVHARIDRRGCSRRRRSSGRRARALTIAVVPMMPPAPGRFSITTGWPPSAFRARARRPA